MSEQTVESNKTAPPKLFISYCWSSPSHENWVLNLATKLRQSGVDVIFDKWDLKEGHDAISFMEQMVSDPSVKKVLMIVDKNYAEKANKRDGGVGTEAQIISEEIYDNQEQDKFVAITVEKDEEGIPYRPVYYESCIHIDFTEPSNYLDDFEKLLRWVFNKPLHLKPEIGTMPEFITSENPIQLSTYNNYKRTVDAIQNSKPHAIGSLS